MLSVRSCWCKGLAWLIIMSSGFDDWNYWTPLLQLQLGITAHTLNSTWVTSVWRISLKGLHGYLNRTTHIHGNPRQWFFVTKMCLLNRWLLSNRSSTVSCITTPICLPKRCLADGYIPSQYVFNKTVYKVVVSYVSLFLDRGLWLSCDTTFTFLVEAQVLTSLTVGVIRSSGNLYRFLWDS
jgi:hypothetical protein